MAFHQFPLIGLGANWMPLVLNAFNGTFVRWSPVFERSCWHAKCKTLWVIDEAQNRLPTECCWVLEWSCWWDHLSSQPHFQLSWQSRGLHNNPTIVMNDRQRRDLKRLQTKPERVIDKSSETWGDTQEWRDGKGIRREKTTRGMTPENWEHRRTNGQRVSQSSTGIEN